MEKYIILLSFLSLFLQVEAKSIPVDIQKAFSAKFPSAVNFHLAKENAKEWEDEFVNEGIKTSANFLLNGSWTETETKISTNQVPVKAKTAIKAGFKDWRIVGADRIIKYSSRKII